MSKQKPETATKAAPQTPEGRAKPSSPEAQVDRVAALSRRADGEPDQSPGHVLITEDAPARD